MTASRVAASCALDAQGVRTQAERYASAGLGARLRSRTARRLEVLLRGDVDADLVDELVAVERACCPFFKVSWDRDRLLLGLSVSRSEDEPALTAVAFALGLGDG